MENSQEELMKTTLNDDFATVVRYATQHIKTVDEVRCCSIITIKMKADVHSNSTRVSAGGV